MYTTNETSPRLLAETLIQIGIITQEAREDADTEKTYRESEEKRHKETQDHAKKMSHALAEEHNMRRKAEMHALDLSDARRKAEKELKIKSMEVTVRDTIIDNLLKSQKLTRKERMKIKELRKPIVLEEEKCCGSNDCCSTGYAKAE